MTVHSILQPGRPRDQGESQPGSSAGDFCQSKKSKGPRRLARCFASGFSFSNNVS